MQEPRVILGSDHRGYDLKEYLKVQLGASGYKVEDCGCFSGESCDYPNFAFEVGKMVALNKNAVGILICATGTGMNIAANKIKGIRAAPCSTNFMVQRAREHNDANVLCLGADMLNGGRTLSLVRTFLSTPFSREEKHIIRIRMVDEKSVKINREIEKGKRKK